MATLYTQVSRNKAKSLFYLLFFALLIMALGWFASYYFGDPSILVIAVGVSIAMSLFSYFGGDKVALAASRAKPIQSKDNPYVWNLVENLAITAGLPIPKVYVIDDPAPNAFATGRSPQHASIAVTTGLVKKLENEELEGVIAHELAHVGNYDMRLMTIVVVMVGIVTLLADIFLRMAFWGGGDSREGGQLRLILMIVGFVLVLLSPIFAMLIQMAISRRREFLADATGALLTRYPEGLASALEKIDKDHRPMRTASNATAHLYIENPFNDRKGITARLSGLFNTHPPTAKRIKALRDLSV
ncbi:MAG: M48 family metallopeptidase [bacterium]|nr:M48 family metallopeptidase [bacterium]MDZ4247985.1 M48 family metallopeptidase [Patescibacteria group bacterium]